MFCPGGSSETAFLQLAPEKMSFLVKESLSKWFVSKCNFDKARADELEERLHADCFIDSVGSLRQCVRSTPDVLEVLQLPSLVVQQINAQLSELDSKKLDDLTVSDVSNLLQNIFVGEPHYCARFFKARVSGFVLTTVTDGKQLEYWGVARQHAMLLLGYLDKWRSTGVPNFLLKGDANRAYSAHKPMVSTY